MVETLSNLCVTSHLTEDLVQMSDLATILSQLSSSDIPPESALLEKAHNVFLQAPPTARCTGPVKDGAPKKLANDAIGVARSFENAHGELANVDSANPGQHWSSHWGQLGSVHTTLFCSNRCFMVFRQLNAT